MGAVVTRKSPPLSLAVPRNIQNWPACRLGCSSVGQSPGGAAANVSNCVMMYGGSHWRGRPVACRVSSPHVTSPRSWRVARVRRCGRESRRRARGTSRTERYMPFCGTSTPSGEEGRESDARCGACASTCPSGPVHESVDRLPCGGFEGHGALGHGPFSSVDICW